MAFDAMTFMQRYLANPSDAPSKRSVKNRSGRAGRKQANGARWVARVGGFADDVRATYAPADTEMCRVVPNNVGWLPDGRPRRF